MGKKYFGRSQKIYSISAYYQFFINYFNTYWCCNYKTTHSFINPNAMGKFVYGYFRCFSVSNWFSGSKSVGEKALFKKWLYYNQSNTCFFLNLKKLFPTLEIVLSILSKSIFLHNIRNVQLNNNYILTSETDSQLMRFCHQFVQGITCVIKRGIPNSGYIPLPF